MKFTPFAKLKEQGIAMTILAVGGLVAAGIGYGVIPDAVGTAIAGILCAIVGVGFALVLLFMVSMLLSDVLIGLGKALRESGVFLYYVFEGGYKDWKSLRHYRELYMDGFEVYVRKQDPLLARYVNWDDFR